MKTNRMALLLDNVTVAYHISGEIRPILKDIQLEITQGEWVGIVGKNGSGKSTLAKVLTGVCPISRGKLQREIQSPVQMVFQNPEAQIVGETVYEDVCFGMENQSSDPAIMPVRAREVLDQVGLHVAMDRQTSELSGGQKQLLNIASCLAVDASVIVFDEATAMLDPMARTRILENVRDLHRKGITIIWITQWMEELAFAQRVVALSDGKVAFDGSSQDFFYQELGTTVLSPCERIGFSLPYAVQVAKQLVSEGYSFDFLPVSAEELSVVVKSLWQ